MSQIRNEGSDSVDIDHISQSTKAAAKILSLRYFITMPV